MIIDLSNSNFKHIFHDEQFYLPIRWDGIDYYSYLKSLYDNYINKICYLTKKPECELLTYLSGNHNCPYADCIVPKIRKLCDNILCAIEEYFKGFPNSAFEALSDAMNVLIKNPIKVYQKSGWTEAFDNNDPLYLFRVVNEKADKTFPRSRVFHAPYNMRSKVSTSRYSIAGYPSLYLGTNIELCLKELNCNPYRKHSLCSRFVIDRNRNRNDYQIDVIELAIKPQDFLTEDNRDNDNSIINKGRRINSYLLDNNSVQKAYIMWYPLIAACSFIRAFKSDPFAPEYIIPQMLMQWLRKWNTENNKLFGLRYFSCSSKYASDIGFNYVFPTSGRDHPQIQHYCQVLVDSFKLSLPEFIHEYRSIDECEQALISLPNCELDYLYK